VKQVVPVEARTAQSYLKYLDKLKHLSQSNRKIPTASENKFWKEVLSRDKTGYRFLRQKPIGQLILDFYCSKLALAIEIDGSSHLTKQNYDYARDRYLEDRGIITIRYSNFLVDNEIAKITKDLKQKIDERAIRLNLK
jgi:very-short-patch-repair endonuclease